MIDMESMFRYKVPDRALLLADGFAASGGVYTKGVPILQNQFTVQLTVTDAGAVDFQVFEAETREEYVLVKVPSASGGFVGCVREACEGVLADVADRCFRTELRKAEQAKRITTFLEEHYEVKPEFLWERYPNYAVFRIPENGKWFAAIMSVDRGKLGLPGQGSVEIIDLKDRPERIAQHLEDPRFLKGYHMNKRHWYTVCLDGQIPDAELQSLIHASYTLTAEAKK